MQTLRSADLMTGTITIVIGIVTLVASRSIKAMAGESLDPRTLPAIVGWGMVLCGAGIMRTGWRYRGDPVPVHWPDRQGRRRLMVTGALLLAYVILIEPIGFRHRYRRLCCGPLLVSGPLPALGRHSGGGCDRGHRVLRVHGTPGAHLPARTARIPTLARRMQRRCVKGVKAPSPDGTGAFRNESGG